LSSHIARLYGLWLKVRNHNVRDLAREHTKEAIKTLVRVMRDSKSDQARAGAACQILDRGWGKPAQTQDLKVNDKRDVREWTKDELLAFLNEAFEQS
jgi:hypothetical protein